MVTKFELQNKNEFGQLMACYCKKPELIKQYPLVEEDRVENFHWYIYQAIESLINQGYKSIDAYEVETLLKEHYPSRYLTYLKHQGTKYLQASAEFATVDNVKTYYATVKKYCILRELNDNGIDISEYYTEDIDPEKGEEVADRFLTATTNQIITHYEDKFKETFRHIRAVNKASLTEELEIYDPFELPDADVVKKPIIEGMMLENTMNSIIAPPKAGKSFFSYQLAYCVQNGIDFLGRKTNKKDVLYVDFELRNDAVKERCEKLKELYNLENGENIKIMPLSAKWGNPDITLDNIIDKVKDYKEINPDLGLVIFDCYYRFAEGEENKAEDTMATLSKLKMLTSDMTVVYVHHTNKTGGQQKDDTDVLNSGSGSGVHGRVVDQTYKLIPKKEGIIVYNTGRDWYSDKLVCRRAENGYFELDDAETQALKTKDEKKNKEKKISLRNELMKNYPELCELIGEDGIDLRNSTLVKLGETRESLKEKGFVIPKGSRKVTLPPA